MKSFAITALVTLAACKSPEPAHHVDVFPTAAAGTTPTRWDYHCLDHAPDDAELADAGDQGWELVTAWCFKRPRDGAVAAAPPPPLPPRTPEPPGLDDDEISGIVNTLAIAIQQVDDTHYEVKRDLVTVMLEHPDVYTRGARVVPALNNGQPAGLKLYAIHPGSLFDDLGLANGDTVRTLDGTVLDFATVLTTVQQASARDQVVVELVRRGQPLTITYAIR